MSSNQPLQLPTRERTDDGRPVAKPPPVVFVGGTGRSGTHVLAKLLGRHHKPGARARRGPLPRRDRGFPGLLVGQVSKDQFRPPPARLLVEGLPDPPHARPVPLRPGGAVRAAVATFEAGFDDDPEAACRRLFYDLLAVRQERAGADGLVEQSCDTVARAPTLAGSSPRRSSSTSSATAATPRPRGSARRTGSSTRGPGARASSGGRSASGDRRGRPGRSRATACSP